MDWNGSEVQRQPEAVVDTWNDNQQDDPLP